MNVFCFLGNRAADNFRNAADEAKNRSGYGSTSSSPSSRSGSFSSGQTTTDKIKDKASEYAQQAKSTVCEFLYEKKMGFLIVNFYQAQSAGSTAQNYAHQAANKAREGRGI